MMINKISEVNALNTLQNTKRSNNVAGSQYASDEISVSDEAKAMAEAMFMNKVAEETPDVRSELVEQIKLKIQITSMKLRLQLLRIKFLALTVCSFPYFLQGIN